MKLEEIKHAVLSGKTVHWKDQNYVVLTDATGQWFISCISSKYCIGLTWSDGITLNGKEDDFYVAVTAEDRVSQLELYMNVIAIELTEIAKRIGYPDRDYDPHDIYVQIKEAAAALSSAANSRKPIGDANATSCN